MPLSRILQTVFDLTFDYIDGNFSSAIAVGEMFDFLAYDILGISTFTISGTDLSEAVDPTDPFVVGLTFLEGGFSSILSIDAITVDTDGPVDPLPASGLLLVFGLQAMVLQRRRLDA